VFFSNGQGNVWCDYPVYANFSYNIEQTHIEGAYLFTESITTDKYHYSDIWPSVIFTILFDANNLYVYLLLVIPLFATLIFQGGRAILEAIGLKNPFLNSALGLLLLFIKPITIFFNSNLYFAFFDYPKLGGVFLFFLAAGLLYFQKKQFLSGLVLLGLISFYSPVAPGVICGLIAAAIVCNYKKGAVLFIRQITYILLAIIFYVAFYYIFNKGSFSHNSTTDYTVGWVLWFFAKKAFLYSISFSLSILLLLGLSKIINYQFRESINNKRFLLVPVVFVLIGTLTSIIAGGLYSLISIEGSQLLKSFAAPMFSVLYFFIIGWFLSKTSVKRAKIISLVLLCGLVFNAFNNNSMYYFGNNNSDWEGVDTESYVKIKKLTSADNRQFAYLRNYPKENDFFGHFYRIISFPPMHKIVHFNGFYMPHCLSVFDIPDNIPIKYDDRHLSLFFQYVKNQKRNHHFYSLTQSQIDFIREHNIGYLIVEKEASIPSDLLRLTEEKLTDNVGNTFYVLKKQ
jgi:hypothetical protein